MVSLVDNGELSLTVHHALSYKYVYLLLLELCMQASLVVILQCVFIFVYSVL